MGVNCTVCSPTGPDIKLGSSKLIEKSGIMGLLYYWYRVSKYFKENDFDMVWFHNPLFFKNNPFQRSLITIHSTYYGKMIQRVTPKNYYKIASKIEGYCLNKMKGKTRFTGVGFDVCKELEEIGINRQKITHISNGVDTKQFKPADNKKMIRKKFGIPEESLMILSLGRLTEAKQPLKLIEVFSIVEEEIEDVNLAIAGNGELLEKTKKYVRQKRLKNVLFLGYVNHKKDAPDLYACFDYFVISSKYEGGGPTLTVAEAMASELPCIVSDIPNFRFIERVKSGIVINFNDVEKAAEEILEYLKRDNSDHSKNAREYAVNNLDWNIIAKRYLKFFYGIENAGDKNFQ
jgi:glycosyltransferase involved in cell wall biosynthesis